jgi:hypothetical protein
VVCQYAFGYTYDHLQSEGFNEGFHDAFMAASEFGLLAMQLPWLDRVSGDAIKIGEDWKC